LTSGSGVVVVYHRGVRPSTGVQAAFGVAGTAQPLVGGQGTAWRVGDAVLKPLDVLEEELCWLDRVARERELAGGIRLSLPIRSESDQLVVDGWTAFPYLAGEHLRGKWLEIATVARQFAVLFSDVPRPAFIDRRMHAWAKADRFAWGEDKGSKPVTAPRVAELVHARRLVSAPSGIVHGDLSGNVLFDSAQPLAVIDLTVYWHPIEYSVAVIAVDAVCFESAPLCLLETISSDDDFSQYLVRALLFRIVTDWFNGRPATEYGIYAAAVDRTLELAASDERRPGR
jgi:uncharacterized protein (TIGR02569 family)